MKIKIGFRLWILIIVLLFSLLAIKPSFDSGAVVTSIEKNSSIFEAGLRQGEIIQSINSHDVNNKEEYSSVVNDLFIDAVEKRVDVTTKTNEYTILTNRTLEITVEDVPKTKIQTGLDLRGGARALVQPDVSVSDSELQDLVAISRNRFNVYGLSDVNIKGITDLSGNKFMLVEVAGATPADLEQLISQQGKFEAKVGNVTVFEGGNRDISDVCRNDATCAGIRDCFQTQEGYVCNFQFAVYLKQEAAQRHADATKNLSLDETGQYLSEKLYLFVDDNEVDSLLIGSSLRGQVTTQISIQGSGSGPAREDAIKDTKESMNRLQTVLLTGSLPYKLEIVKLDTISPTLGQEFIKSIFIAVIAAIVVVSLVVLVRYRKVKASLALLVTSFSELIIILGVAALIRWNLDLPSIAGILATIGTGVDQQIIILDEAGRSKTLSIKERIKRASTIILSAYLTLIAAMIPLYWAGAGLFKGFALTTIIGVTAGVLITRPAFAEIIKRLES
ncbi:MAG: MMPL family transporter [Nanoarchaeota archaeon]|nr:MMPL family transporter [Nanoarchaeota archaeon]MBU1988488.1 MMPL family transporter [Nanoarchaeota archaeon]